MSSKVQIDIESLRALGERAKENGTTVVFVDLALDWAQQASDRIAALEKDAIRSPIPILLNHDRSKAPIGSVTEQGGRLCVEFAEDMRITQEMFFDIFGNAGVRVLEAERRSDDLFFIKKGEILCFALSPSDSAKCRAPGAISDCDGKRNRN